MDLIHLPIAFCVTTFILLVTKSSSQTWEASYYETGLLIVADVPLKDCHTCLIQMAGVHRLILVKEFSGTRTYLVKGRAATLDLISVQCIDMKLCQLQTDISQFQTWTEPFHKVSVIEYSISVLSTQMEIKVSNTAHTDTPHVISPILQSYKGITVFFSDVKSFASHNVYTLAKSEKIPSKKTVTETSNLGSEWRKQMVKGSPGMSPHRPGQSSHPRCFVCLSCSFQCERCLSLHSTSFGIRTYYVKFQACTMHTIYAFASIYDLVTIDLYCGINFCPTMESLSDKACSTIDYIFSTHKKALNVAGASITEEFAKFYRNDEVTRANANKRYQSQLNDRSLLSSMEDIWFINYMSGLDALDVRRTEISTPFYSKSKLSMQVENVLMRGIKDCAHLHTSPNSRAKCISCMLLVIKTGMLVSTISQTEVMVFFQKTDLSATVDCVRKKACLQIKTQHPTSCHTHRKYHRVNPNVYPELSIFKNLILERPVCAVISHKARSHQSCRSCVQRVFKKKTHQLVSEIYSLLLSSITENKELGLYELERVLHMCLGRARTKCVKVQLFPEMICSEHEQYKESTESGDRVTDDTREQLRMGKDKILLWPPINNVGHGDTIADERAVFMVEFEAKRPELCIRCMVSRTEVFFFSVVYHNQFGYFWMTQNHKGVLEYCLKNVLCTNLWYSAKE